MPILPGVVDSSNGDFPTWVTTAGNLGNVYDVERGSKTFQLQANNPDSGSLIYSIVGGALPTGATLSSSGLIGGTPNAVGSDTTYNFTVRVQNLTKFVDRAFSFVVKAPVKTTYNVNAGSLQTFSKPSDLTQLSFKMWASGGAGGFSSTGGAGGYLGGKVNLSSSTSALQVWVPDGGLYVASGGTVTNQPGYFPWGNTPRYAPGFSQSGSGGGGAALRDATNNIYYAISGGGGGGSGNFGNAADQDGGAGGGDVAQNGGGDKFGFGGSQSAGGRTAFNRSIIQNLVHNPSFESSMTGWGSTGLAGTYTTADSYWGNSSCLLSYNGTTTVGLASNTFNVSPGQVITSSFWMKRSADIGTVTSNFIIYQADGSTLVADFSHAGFGTNINTSGWYRATQTITCPPLSGKAFLRIYITPGEGAGSTAFNTYIDGVMVTATSSAPSYFDPSFTNLLTNPDFESGSSPWSLSSTTTTAANRVTGTTAAVATTSIGGNYATVQQTVTSGIFGGKQYTASAFIKAPTVWSYSRFGLQIVWQTSGGSYITESNIVGPTPGDPNWGRYSLTTTAPSNAAQAVVRIFTDAASFSSATSYFVDGVSLYQGDFDGFSSSPVFTWDGASLTSSSTANGGSENPGGLYYGGAGSNSYANFSNGGGEGGHGYYGGAGGLSGGAGGASSWINPTYLVSKTSTRGNYNTAPNTGDVDYSAGIAVGGNAQSTGGNGKVVLIY